MTHSQALENDSFGFPGRDCHRELLSHGTTCERTYLSCSACNRAIVLDVHGQVVTSYALGRSLIKELAASFVLPPRRNSEDHLR